MAISFTLFVHVFGEKQPIKYARSLLDVDPGVHFMKLAGDPHFKGTEI